MHSGRHSFKYEKAAYAVVEQVAFFKRFENIGILSQHIHDLIYVQLVIFYNVFTSVF
jgi:hypothetical protein